MGTNTELEEALETSREDFEIHIARARWNKLQALCIWTNRSFEDDLPELRAAMVWDVVQKFYCPSLHSEWLKNLQKDWETWKTGFEAGWEAR
jgi:hypothetical protein